MLADRLCRLRRTRTRELPELAIMFADPAWDILLDLYVARVRGKLISVSSACIAGGTSNTTGLRWLRRLERCGAIVRKPDPVDARRSFLELQPTTFHRLTAWLVRARDELQVYPK